MNHSFARKAVALLLLIAAVFATVIVAPGEKPKKHTDRDRLIGTWHLLDIHSPSPDAQPPPPLPVGLLIFTADGYQAVQLMYPEKASTLNNNFVHDGYEASFGTFEVDEAQHLLRYHPTASATRAALIGTDELLKPSFPDEKHLVIRPADPKQQWSVTWQKN